MLQLTGLLLKAPLFNVYAKVTMIRRNTANGTAIHVTANNAKRTVIRNTANGIHKIYSPISISNDETTENEVVM